VSFKTSRLILLKNAFANVARGSSTALVSLVLPPFLVRSLTTNEFGIWILILQISTYASFLDFGIQTAVGRFVAYTNELKDLKRRNTIICTALAILIILGLVGILVISILAWQLTTLFHNLQPNLVDSARASLIIVGISTAIGLPASVFSSIFIGFQRYEIPAIIIGGSKLLGGILLVIVANQSKNLIFMSITVAIINILSYFMLYTASKRLFGDIKFSIKSISKNATKEIIGYCSSLSIWSFSMLLVAGIDTTLVGIFEFQKVAYYGVAVSLISFVSGLQNSIFSALIPAAAVMNARDSSRELGKLLVKSTRYGILILLITGLPLIILSNMFFNIWLGSSYGVYSAPLLQILVVANIIRLVTVPYVTILLGTGQQSLITLSPLMEGFSNLIFSVVLGIKYGAVGIAAGTLIGSIVGVSFHYFYNIERSTSISFDRGEFLKQGIARPLFSTLPLLMAAAITLSCKTYLNEILIIQIVLIAFIITGITIWRWGMTQADRKYLASSLYFLKMN
jgi:O-antigen/teichoic acid export membrane protein